MYRALLNPLLYSKTGVYMGTYFSYFCFKTEIVSARWNRLGEVPVRNFTTRKETEKSHKLQL